MHDRTDKQNSGVGEGNKMTFFKIMWYTFKRKVFWWRYKSLDVSLDPSVMEYLIQRSINTGMSVGQIMEETISTIIKQGYTIDLVDDKPKKRKARKVKK